MSKTNEQKLVDRLNQDLEPGKFIQLEGKVAFGPLGEENKVDIGAPGTLIYVGHFRISSSGDNHRLNFIGGYFDFHHGRDAQVHEKQIHIPIDNPENYGLDLFGLRKIQY